MAHRGKLYPRSLKRYLSPDVSPQLQLAERYFVTLPAGTGALANDFPTETLTDLAASAFTGETAAYDFTFLGQSSGRVYVGNLAYTWVGVVPDAIWSVTLSEGGILLVDWASAVSRTRSCDSTPFLATILTPRPADYLPGSGARGSAKGY